MWLSYVKWCRDLIYRRLAICKPRQDRAARRIGERREDRVEI
jgi:hypothetical protein